jgi:hypothetical protein
MRNSVEYTIMDARSTTGIGNNIFCQDFRHAVISFNTSGNTNCTAKFVGSIAESAPNFANAQTPANAYDFVEAKDLQDGSAIDGDAGVVLSGTDDNRLFEINVNGLQWLNARLTAISAGAVTIKVRLYND